LLTEADRCDVPIIPNEDKDKTVLQIIHQVNFVLSRHYTGTPQTVFGAVVDDIVERAGSSQWLEIVSVLNK
jgi:hypothetical protein